MFVCVTSFVKYTRRSVGGVQFSFGKIVIYILNNILSVCIMQLRALEVEGEHNMHGEMLHQQSFNFI